MKKTRFTESHILKVLKEQESEILSGFNCPPLISVV